MDADYEIHDGILTVYAYVESGPIRAFDGEEKMVRKVEHTVSLPEDEELAEAIGNALLGYYADQQDASPPGGKPMHQRYAAMEPDS